jgi:peptidylprolyl isomerase
MNRVVLTLFLAAFTAAANAQTAPKEHVAGSTTPKSASSASATAKPSIAKPSKTAGAPEPWIKLPPGVPKVKHGPVVMPFAVRYEDIKVGTGPVGEPGKLWHLKFTVWLAASGVKFDSWEDHSQPIMGKDGKPELGPDGKPKMGPPEPLVIMQGMHNMIPGVDLALEGMRIGGERRIFVPWQLAFGTRAIPARPDRPGVPAKSDLIFDAELVSITELPQHSYPPIVPGNRPMPSEPHPGASAQPKAAPAAKPASPATPEAKPASSAPAQPQTQPK